MFFATRPTPAQTAAFLRIQQVADFSYREVGQSQNAGTPRGYVVDRFSYPLGHGEDCFQRSAQALREWKMFRAGWITLQNPAAPFEVGQTLVLLIRHLGFYSLIANRVVYITETPQQVGFGYGTLTGHAEQGEERFLVRQLENGDVVFEIFAFSKPRHPLARLGTPVVRQLQKAAARAYGEALKQAIR